jgi:hypothetical protein
MALVLAGGCAWWATLAFLRTRAMAEFIGASESEVRALGVRDAGNGLALALSRDPRPAIGARVAFDLADAVRYARGRPKVAALTLGFAALGAAALASRSPSR